MDCLFTLVVEGDGGALDRLRNSAVVAGRTILRETSRNLESIYAKMSKIAKKSHVSARLSIV